MQAGREIRFRAWNQKKYIMVYADEDGSADYWDGVCVSDVEMVNATLERKNRYVWMQFTGLRDKNGKEIFEGDVVSYRTLTHENIGKICFGEYDQDGSGGEYSPVPCLGFYIERIKMCLADWEIEMELEPNYREDEQQISPIRRITDVEVIGNIYENPSLAQAS